ncbi:hypothetical protein GUITHDRAFT_165977 [Guillardia theta CCMP2712]|uniref:Uncharacterized protein n=1 Tax=Guillardia theta (strain CCMP2712) TaxID=905079 RepID=L1IGJ7_GUITC|nr:hypothetical protein GUITHDRAFT_165977 [Guillardia theta CCMP2712]EKX35376.1 hypothetical protein GUITHDRAFT_165977 [Guillardia theta CCMP2712]|eukprot:XP_005822356.1 hypothetical protein GUITHDRAFT_165977 [Guillardia theta CCMP2712]
MSSTSSPVGPTPMEIRDDSKTPTHHLSFNGGEDRDNSPAPNRADGEPAHGKRSEGASASTRPDEVEVDVGASERKKEERGADRFYVGGYAVGGSKENRERLSLLDSPLFRAVGNADADAVDDLYKKGDERRSRQPDIEPPPLADPHQILKTYDWGWSISHFAAATGMYEILEWTAERRETKELLTRVNDCGLTPMHYAAANGQYDALEFLVRTVPGSCFSLRKAQGSDRTRLRMHLRRVQRRQEAHRHREEGQVQEASDRHASQERVEEKGFPRGPQTSHEVLVIPVLLLLLLPSPSFLADPVTLPSSAFTSSFPLLASFLGPHAEAGKEKRSRASLPSTPMIAWPTPPAAAAAFGGESQIACPSFANRQWRRRRRKISTTTPSQSAGAIVFSAGGERGSIRAEGLCRKRPSTRGPGSSSAPSITVCRAEIFFLLYVTGFVKSWD